ncbi:hypothetical protein IB244_18530 [Rhizobium sp. RHZ02]|uniref:hypothetical protein n=1 Tax=Rhizobium sp. RHZ02 TaxID=2769306 RepID=UPI00177CF6C7|nr:hypothetical protein [Rhizobium sp. RHZ02]MBD9453537.1 hypothetical protein [Rhizobium sp. RHZ02]
MKVLLLDTAFAAMPIYRGLIEAGHQVWVMGNRPADLLARVASSAFIEHSYADVSEVETHVTALGIDCVVPGCTDVSMETCVKLTHGVQRLDSVETNLSLSNKAQFRALCGELNLPAPRVSDPASFPRQGSYICKPVDAYSGKGISVFDGTDPVALKAAIETAATASRTGNYLIEDYVGDALYSCSGFLRDCRFTDVFFVREGSSVNPYAVDTSFVVDDFPSHHAELLVSALERLAGHLGLTDGLLHTQFIQSADGPKIVEVSRRCPGDLYPLLIEYSTGFRFAAKYAAALVGYEFDTSVSVRRYILRHTVTADFTCDYGGLVFSQKMPTLAFYPIALMGERLQAKQASRAGINFSEHPSKAELELSYGALLRRDCYRVSGELPTAAER